MDKLVLLIKYISFLSKSGNQHSIHSPFVFDLYTKAIKPKKQFYSFAAIEKLRNALLNSKEIITIQDLGAGSKIEKSSTRKVSSIAKNSLKSKKLAQLLFKLVEHLKPEVLFDLGTSLGITTLYLATSNSKSKVYTFEGCPSTSKIAQSNFDRFKAKNITIVDGDLNLSLIQQLNEIPKVDFVFFDANHQYQPTMDYFHLCLTKAHEETCFVFDDIHWSDDMENAWKEIIKHPEVTVSIDLFYLGIVFFRKKQPKEHFVLRS